MSTFNTRKDRTPDGMPKSHRHPPSCWIGTNPGWWNRTFTTKPRRADDRENEWRVLAGYDPDGLVWMPDRRPNVYFW